MWPLGLLFFKIMATGVEVRPIFYSGLPIYRNKMCYETQMPPYEVNSRGGYNHQNPRSRSIYQNLSYQYKGLVTRNMHMKYKSHISVSYHSKNMANFNVFKM
jgi:hypothetical protein